MSAAPTSAAPSADPTADPPVPGPVPGDRPKVDLAVLDMAGTTVVDDGLVDAAFAAALAEAGIAEGGERAVAAWRYVRATMGRSKIEVFRALVDSDAAVRANAAFERTYLELVDAGRAAPVPGALAAIGRLRAGGIRVALTTGFARGTQERLLDALGWSVGEGGTVDLALCPADVGRGRPFPDLVLTAVLRLRADDVARVAVVGDTTSDVESGRRAGAGIVAGVLTGAHDEPALRAAGATAVLGSVAELPALVLPAPVPPPGPPAPVPA